jgi:hypothetical protein
MEFRTWLEEKEKKEKNREGIGSKILSLAIPMGGSILGGLAGGTIGGPAAILPAYLAAKHLLTKHVEKNYPQSTTDLMKKK